MESEIVQDVLPRVSDFLARTMGVRIPGERLGELRRGVAGAAEGLGFEGDVEGCLRWLAEGPMLSGKQLEALAGHLTVGETYFFRERRHFEFLAERVLPELARRGDRRLRIWSAGCCSGEEAYSLAILLRRSLPDLACWDVTLLGTDINPVFLRKGEAGVYGPWSFRDVPEWLKGGYFRGLPNGHFEVLPEIRRMVRFSQLNLAGDSYPSLLNEMHGMDVVFCRNVLMYFDAGEAKKVMERIYRTQREGGWLFISSSELGALAPAHYGMVRGAEVTAFRKGRGEVIEAKAVWRAPVVEKVVEVAAEVAPRVEKEKVMVEEAGARAEELYGEGRYGEAAEEFIARFSARGGDGGDVGALGMLTECLANQGRLGEALAWCERSIEADKCNAGSQYLRALILQEQGAIEEAGAALRRVLFLDPDFVLAHVTLGTLARKRGEEEAARRHLAHAKAALEGLAPDAVLLRSEGMTSKQLGNMIRSLMGEEVVS